MRLYAGPSREFIEDSAHNRIAEDLKAAFRRHFRYDPPGSEYRSWRDSLRALSQVFAEARLYDHGVVLEYQLPLTSKRLDCLITGRDGERRESAVIVELKQWERCELTEGEDLVRTYVGGAQRDVLHPCAQANQYRRYLADMHEAFHGQDAIRLSACAYLHNYIPGRDDAVLSAQFNPIRAIAPLYTANAVPALTDFLSNRLQLGQGLPVLERIERSRFRPSKRLLDHVSNVINNEPRFVLLDEQQVVFQRVLARVTAGLDRDHKHVFLIRGGPGTGKSVLAINLMSELSARGFNAQYATGSRAFTRTLQRIVGRRAGQQFKYFNNYGSAEPGVVDLLICDESHRIRASSNHQYTRTENRSTKPQIQELIDASKVSVFFIDDRQVVRPGEVGSTQLIRQTAAANGCALEEHRLEAQFRCQGSEAFVNWVDNTLDIQATATPIWDQSQESFELRIVESPQALDELIRTRCAEGATARLTAGFCWPWSKAPNDDGSLSQDVVIGEFKRAWNAHPDIKGLGNAIPPADLWAYEPGGIDQLGCIYTAQGFEFDYVGVIWGEDLVYDLDGATWRGRREKSCDTVVRRDGQKFSELVKNTYRTLLTRGLKGCYIYFLDKNTERFVRSRTEALGTMPRGQLTAIARTPASSTTGNQTGAVTAESDSERKVLPFRRLRPSEIQQYVNSVPLVDLKFAAGAFSEAQTIDPDEVEWIELPDIFRPRPGLFVAQVIGESMNRRIHNGAWCLFRLNPAGTRQGKVVVAQHRSIHDPDLGGSYTVKIYQSRKKASDEGEWEHERITLIPDSTDPKYQPIELDSASASQVRVIAELIAILPTDG
jgi:phage repressor protein C with HTH and peptisase S24 domain